MMSTGFRKFLPLSRKQSLRACFLAGLAFGLLGCNYGTMTVGSYDGATGKTSTTVYSKYYDNGTWLIKDKLGVVVLVDHEKKNIPVSHGLAQSLGALGPSDSVASGKLSFTLWNFDSVPHQVKFKRLIVPSGSLDFQNELFSVAPHEQMERPAGTFPISNYGTSIDVTLEVEFAGKPRRIKMTLLRRTRAQQELYFSDGAARPYPWGARQVTQ